MEGIEVFKQQLLEERDKLFGRNKINRDKNWDFETEGTADLLEKASESIKRSLDKGVRQPDGTLGKRR